MYFFFFFKRDSVRRRSLGTRFYRGRRGGSVRNAFSNSIRVGGAQQEKNRFRGTLCVIRFGREQKEEKI